MYTISSFGVNKLNNAEFTGFFINLNHLIEGTGIATLGIDETVMAGFTSLLTKLNDQVRITSASTCTVEMDEAQTRRVSIFKRIIYRLRGVEVSDGDNALKALRTTVETHLLKTYSMAVTRLPLQELTTTISGFIYDVKQYLDEDDLDTLGISADISSLELANNAFVAAYMRRSTERAETLGITQQLRQQMSDAYLSICYQVQYLANSTLTANASKAAACQPFIGTLNAILADVKKRYTQRMNALHNASEGEGSADDTPADDSGNPGDSGDSGNPGGAGNPGADENPGDENPDDDGYVHDGAVEF